MTDLSVHADVIFAGDDAGGALVQTSNIGGLVAEHDAIVNRAEWFAGLIGDGNADLLDYFLDGNRAHDGGRYGRMEAEKMFALDGARKAIGASFWSRALNLTDVYECMPKARRDEWDESIRKMSTPPFTEDNVRATLGDLMQARPRFMAERVNGIWSGLSREHVTNKPEGFGARMILSYVFNDYGHSTSRLDHIHDLRCVVLSLMSRPAPDRGSTWNMLESMRRGRTGEWHVLDGGALRIRVYLKGTAHLEVHPDVAWRLNRILAMLHPGAIPSQFREKPAKPRKAFAVLQTPIRADVLSAVRAGRVYQDGGAGWRWSRGFDADARSAGDAQGVLASIGGAIDGKHVLFDFDPSGVIGDVLMSGVLPDQKSHQFYPTPDELAARVADALEIEDGQHVLEPSAGHGALIGAAIRDRAAGTIAVHAVELSGLHCEILRSRFPDAEVAQGDFLDLVDRKRLGTYDRILMNPPFADGRAVAHVKAAASLLAPAGRLVAIVPASLRGKTIADGMQHSWSEPIHNAFADAGVSVAILTADAPLFAAEAAQA